VSEQNNMVYLTWITEQNIDEDLTYMSEQNINEVVNENMLIEWMDVNGLLNRCLSLPFDRMYDN
jgi:hypothetical protein